MNFLPGWNPGFIPSASAYAPASYVFNGTDEAMTRTWVTTAPSQTIFTYSVWFKMISFFNTDDYAPLCQTINTPSNSRFVGIGPYGGAGPSSPTFEIFGLTTGGSYLDYGQYVSLTVPFNVWEHWVVQYDSTQGVADNRIRMYRNGIEQSDINDSDYPNPGSSDPSDMFVNGRQHQIGRFLDAPAYFNGKIAFIEMLEGVSAGASSFGFDNSGTWTRKPYTGSRGTYGFSLDGTALFNDVGSNGQNFTGVNMDATNLNFVDLPPYIG